MIEKKISKRVGGFDRAKIARAELSEIYKDTEHELYFAKDIELAKKYNVSRHTIYKIREEMNIPPRSKRVLEVLKSMDTKSYNLKELTNLLNIKYQNLYKMVTDFDIPYKNSDCSHDFSRGLSRPTS
jgi:hypothetical protein